MQTEYGAESRLEQSAWKVLRWVMNGDATTFPESQLPTGARLAFDAANRLVVLFADQWSCDYFTQKHPDLNLSALPPGPPIEVEAAA
jgi:peptide chain release factor 3